jgi:hypothetical protein
MTDKNEIMQQYGFVYVDCDGKTYKKEIVTEGSTWMECLNDYVRFLESVFQYSIMNKVRLQEPVYLSSIYEHYSDYLDPWTGEYFVDEQKETDEDTCNPGLSD